MREPIAGFDLDALARAGTGGDWSPAPPLPDHSSSPRRRLTICVASHDFVGPIRNGGIGTAYTALAEALAADGHQVTALYLHGPPLRTGYFHFVGFLVSRTRSGTGGAAARSDAAPQLGQREDGLRYLPLVAQSSFRRRTFPGNAGAGILLPARPTARTGVCQDDVRGGNAQSDSLASAGQPEILDTYDDLEIDFLGLALS